MKGQMLNSGPFHSYTTAALLLLPCGVIRPIKSLAYLCKLNQSNELNRWAWMRPPYIWDVHICVYISISLISAFFVIRIWESAPLCDLKPWKWFMAQSTHSPFNPLNTCISAQRQWDSAAEAILNAFQGDSMRGEGRNKAARVTDGSWSGWSSRAESKEEVGQKGRGYSGRGCRTETEHVKVRRTEQEEGKRQRKGGRRGATQESEESGLLRGGLTSPRCCFCYFFQSFVSGISLHFFHDIFAWRCPCISALPSLNCLLLLSLQSYTVSALGVCVWVGGCVCVCVLLGCIQAGVPDKPSPKLCEINRAEGHQLSHGDSPSEQAPLKRTHADFFAHLYTLLSYFYFLRLDISSAISMKLILYSIVFNNGS